MLNSRASAFRRRGAVMPLAFEGRDVSKLGVDHQIEVNAQTGEAILVVPVQAPPGRDGLGPTFQLRYSSSAGNSAFGLGWSLGGLASVGIDTRHQLPRWDGRDGYCIGGDELVPWLEPQAGAWQPLG